MTEAASLTSMQAVKIFQRDYRIREVLRTDAAILEVMFSRSSPEDIRLRCLGMIKDFPHLAAVRLAGMDGAHETALLALDDEAAENAAVGVAHIIDDPAIPSTAEFDVMVRTDMKGHGVGFQLMKHILARARERKLTRIEGYVLYENRAMLRLARDLGFHTEFEGGNVVRVVVDL